MKVVINGACGRMGRTIISMMLPDERYEIVAAVDIHSEENGEYPVFKNIFDFDGDADCIIDFSHHSAAADLCRYASGRNIPLVIATTAHTDEEKAVIGLAAKTIPVFYSANMSLGIAVTARLAKTAASLFPDADIEIIETHHNRKLDVPSGTAILLGNALREVRPDAEFNIGRSENGKRPKNEIGIHSIRTGNTVGDHEIIIATDTQSIRIRHEAHDRALFAEGALDAAEFICGKPAGLYDMNSIVG
ncbi:MAG: 4-hydroxy-tetrahydrodipicolinate reductase [Eubacteriaceae bacterium]|nr:4-hydroxy-tetrahydrodipicolinate reductase [Eubacteriaceae bacterium]